MRCSPPLAGGLGGVIGESLSAKIFTTVVLLAIGYWLSAIGYVGYRRITGRYIRCGVITSSVSVSLAGSAFAAVR